MEGNPEIDDQEEEVMEMEDVDESIMAGGMFVGAVTGVSLGFAFGGPH